MKFVFCTLLVNVGVIDEIITEPVGGAHTDRTAAAGLVDAVLERALNEVAALDSATRLAQRYDKFRNIGRAGIDFVDGA